MKMLHPWIISQIEQNSDDPIVGQIARNMLIIYSTTFIIIVTITRTNGPNITCYKKPYLYLFLGRFR